MELPDHETSWMKYFWPLANLCLILLLGYVLVFPYLKAEINSRLHAEHKNDLTQFCQEKESMPPREIKIVDLQRHRQEIKFYCLYGQTSLNQEIVIHKTGGQWRVFSRRSLAENGAFYWPLYF